MVHLYIPAYSSLRANCEYVADDEHPDHQFRINRGSTHFRVKGREIGMNPRQIENRSNLANRVIVRNCLIKMKRIKQLLLVVIEPPIIARLHSESHDSDGITVLRDHQRLSQQNLPISRLNPLYSIISLALTLQLKVRMVATLGDRSSPRRPGRRTQRIEARLLFIAQ